MLFHNIDQNDYFSGKIKQKPFSEVMPFFAFYLLCHNIFQNHIPVTITFYKNSVVKTVEPCPKHNRTCNGYNGNCIGFNGNYNGVYWYVMDSIGGMLNPIGKMPKTHYKNELCIGFTGKS